MIDIKTSALVATGGAALCSEMANSQAIAAITQIVILLTCLVVMGHILINCWIDIRKAKRKKEAARGRVSKADTP